MRWRGRPHEWSGRGSEVVTNPEAELPALGDDLEVGELRPVEVKRVPEEEDLYPEAEGRAAVHEVEAVHGLAEDRVLHVRDPGIARAERVLLPPEARAPDAEVRGPPDRAEE